MAYKNKYLKHSKISEAKFREFIRYFVLDINAQQLASLTGLNRNTVNRLLFLLRSRIAELCAQDSPLKGQIEVDESYFGPRRVRGIKGRGARKKTPVFGILQRNSKVYTQIVPNCSRKTIQAIIAGKVDISSTIHSDSYSTYDGLVDLGYKKHYRIRHGQNEFAVKDNHINGIESFWSFAKRRLMKFHGVPGKTFYLHLKECEFRFNNRKNDLYKLLLKICRENPL